MVSGDEIVRTGGFLVLADIVIGTSLLFDPVKALVTGIGHVFLVETPRDASLLEQVNHR
jgi:hypothetical protein